MNMNMNINSNNQHQSIKKYISNNYVPRYLTYYKVDIYNTT